jgi:hypothetical protein
MGRWGSSLSVALAAAALVAACGANTSALDTTGLTKVEISSFQALPPPLGTRQAVLISPASVTAFRQSIASHHIGMTAQVTGSDGCTGGIEYTIVLHRSGGEPSTTLNAYACGGQITGDLSGDVSGFLSYVDSLLAAGSSVQG